MIAARTVALTQCPDCGGRLELSGECARCATCGRTFSARGGVLDLRPAVAFAEQTKYLDPALHADARHESIAPPLLGSRVRNDQLRAWLRLSAADRAIDLGCGSGRTLVWNAGSGAHLVGLDVSPYFAQESLATMELLLGDLRQLPLRSGAFTKAWSLDVLEHLSPQALGDMLGEANRVLADNGELFVYTHVRKNGWIAGGTRLVNRAAHLCERLGLIDLRQERLRKSDHVNPIANHDELATIVQRAGFHLERIRYYTPIIGAFIENILIRLAERVMARQQVSAGEHNGAAGLQTGGPTADAVARARADARARLSRRGPAYYVLVALTMAMKLDLVLFGRVKSGPFFALLRKVPAPRG